MYRLPSGAANVEPSVTWRLCADTVADGLHVARDYPHCVNSMTCQAFGCFWRRFHQLPPDKYRRKESK